MSRAFRPGGRNAGLVQRALNLVKPWEPGEDPIQGCRLKGVRLIPEAVRITNNHQKVFYAIHRGHKATQPQLSPFTHRKRWPITDVLTIILVGSVTKPIVVSVYPADEKEEYIPPLPWMSSAKSADGGLAFCEQYWKEHAYLLSSPRLIREGTMQDEPPEWRQRLGV